MMAGDRDIPSGSGPLPVGPALHHAWLRRLLPWLSGVLALAGLLLVLGSRDVLLRTWDLARHAGPAWLALAIVAQGGTYVCAAMVWWRVLRRARLRFRLHRLVPLGVAKLFTDQTLPSGGISGNLLVLAGLTRRAVPTNIVMAALLVGMVSFYAAYLLAAVLAGVLLLVHHSGSRFLAAAVLAFAALAVSMPALALWARERLRDRMPAWLARLPGVALLLRAFAEAPDHLLRDTRLLAEATALQFAVFVLDALSLWLVLHAIGVPQALWLAFSATVMAAVLATLGPIPLGLGTFEAGGIAVLRLAGVPMDAALAGTLLLRGLTFWLPMLPGLWLARRELRHHGAADPAAKELAP